MDSGANNNSKSMEESMKNLKIDAAKVSETNMSGPREGTSSDATSCISMTSSIKGSEVDQEAFSGDQGMYYYGYSYPGYNCSFGEWDDQSYLMTADNFDMQPSAVQVDHGSVLYYLPSYQHGYASLNPAIPSAVVGVDNQYLGQPSYYPNEMLQQSLASPVYVPQSVAYGPELVPAYQWDSSVFAANGLQVHGYYDKAPASRSNFSSRNHTFGSKTSASSKSSSSEKKTSSLQLDEKPTAAIPKQPLKPLTKGAPAVLSKGYIPVNKIPSYLNHGTAGLIYPTNPMNNKEGGRNWMGVEKVRSQTKLHGQGDYDLNEQNRGPRTNSNKTSLGSAANQVVSPDAGKDVNDSTVVATVRKDMYNLPDFSGKYDHALFFVIKSYSEDDIHKSIKYNVWASTPNGNRKLDNAFQLAQEKMAENGSKCPVFLFFSVNASGQFCGIAEMLDRVDFSMNMDFWQQDKWNGFFPVKWHIIKDVPNPQFRHIILENNENKPVTNSRDTQEVKFPQGTEMINIFKNYASKTSILDDFDFYENRQKVMQQKRSKPPIVSFVEPSAKIEELTQGLKLDDLNPVSSPPPVDSEMKMANAGLQAVSAE